jgi:hypothetical protein
MTYSSILESRENCPCCHYPTLTQRNEYEICELCDWEDSGHDDPFADEICGGPNSDYSLTEARVNYKLYRTMARPESYKQKNHPDSELEYQTKGLLMIAFDQLRTTKEPNAILEAEIQRLEQILDDETTRFIQECERKNTNL